MNEKFSIGDIVQITDSYSIDDGKIGIIIEEFNFYYTVQFNDGSTQTCLSIGLRLISSNKEYIEDLIC